MQEYTVRVYSNKTLWLQNGELHRADGPAIEWDDGTKEWYQNGELHRVDGPAVEDGDGSKFWFLNGEEVSETDVMGQTITIDGKKVKISKESYEAIKGVI